MDQFFTLAILLGLTLLFAAGLRKPSGALVASVNWDGPAPRQPAAAAERRVLPGKGLGIIAGLLALALALALSGSSQAQTSSVACVNWNGVQQPPAVQACVNWNGVEQDPATQACVNWNGVEQDPAAQACVNWNGVEQDPATQACVNWNDPQGNQG